MIPIQRQKVWEQRYAFGNEEQDLAVRALAADLGVSPLFAVLLYNRGYDTADKAEKFLHFEETDFYDPFLMTDMDRAAKRILSAVENREKIYIYGDYDVDGVTSVSLLYLYLTSLGAEVGIKIPKREGEGYGVSCAAVRTIAEDGAKLIVTVDTGITATAEVELARELGVDFVITDHHECHGELPRAVAVVNPHRADCSYPFCELAGVGVVFKTVCACEMLRSERAGEKKIDGVRRVCAEYAELVAVGTIADVMPLVGENRLIVSFGLSKLGRGEGNKGILSLLRASGKKGEDSRKKKVTSGAIGFGIAPRINAAGRISDALIAVKLLLASDGQTVERYTEELCEINRQRQIEENRIAAEALEMFERTPEKMGERVIILDSDTWQQGIIGIVSSRITERYGLPSILVSFAGCEEGSCNPDDDGKGSGRSIKGLNLVEALGACEDLLVKYGGHSLAAGLTVKRGKIDEFRKRINEYAEKHITAEMLSIRVEADCELEAGDITMELANELAMLEPFGIGNAAPQFILRGATVRKISHIGAGKHTRLSLTKDGIQLVGMYFGVGEDTHLCSEGELVDVLFNIDINEYRGSRSVQLLLHDLVPSAVGAGIFSAERERYKEIKEGDKYFPEENVLPDRDDFARVYTALRKEFRSGVSVLDIRAIQRLLGVEAHLCINYIKLKFILRILNELQICSIEEVGEDMYSFNIFFNASKTSIEKSSILKKLRGQCIKTAE